MKFKNIFRRFKLKRNDEDVIRNEINIYFNDDGDDLQKIIDNLLLELYKKEFNKINCKI